MNSFNVKCPFVHKFNVVVPNFSSFDSLSVEIKYEDYRIRTNPIIMESFGFESIIYDENLFVENFKEFLNIPITVKSDTTIEFDDTKISTIEGFPTNFAINTDIKIKSNPKTIESVKNCKVVDDMYITVDPIVGVLIKLGELDPLTLGDLDNKTLLELYYKNT